MIGHPRQKQQLAFDSSWSSIGKKAGAVVSVVGLPCTGTNATKIFLEMFFNVIVRPEPASKERFLRQGKDFGLKPGKWKDQKYDCYTNLWHGGRVFFFRQDHYRSL